MEHNVVNHYEPSENEMCENEDKRLLANHLASNYRWIPAVITADMHGKVIFDSYINGIHPFEEKELYDTIAEIMEYFLPKRPT